MTQASISNLDKSGEVRKFKARGEAVLGTAGGVTLMKATFQPGWRWSKDIAPIAGTDSCQTRHLGYVLSGKMRVIPDDGEEFVVGPGDLFDIPAGHDARVVGKEPCVMIDTSPDATRYATGGAKTAPSEDRYLSLVRRGYEAFNEKDVKTLAGLMSQDVVQHVPGESVLAHDYKGIDAVLGYYGQLSEMTDGTFRADLIETHGDGHGHVVAVHQLCATRNGVTRVSRGSILFTFLGDKVTDLLELRADVAGDDAFMSG